MNLFGDKPQEKAMQRLIHDTNMGFSHLNMAAKIIEKELKEKNIDIPLPVLTELKYISESKLLKKTIDDYYEKFKTGFNQ